VGLHRGRRDLTGDGMASLLQKVNDALAIRVTVAISTVWCVYAFTVLSLLPLWAPALQAQILYVSNCFQLVFLPLIMVGQKLMEDRSKGHAEELAASREARAAEDHQTILSEFAEIKAMHAEIAELLKLERDDG
jgi:hypothetical protein